MTRRGAAVFLLALALPACGMRPAARRELEAAANRPAAAPATSVPSAGTPTGATPPGPTVSSSSSPAPRGSGSTARPGAATPPAVGGSATVSPGATASSGRPFPLDATLQPACITRGTQVTATVTTRPHAAIGYAVGYSNNEAYGTFGADHADPSGRYVLSFTVNAAAPNGPAKLLLSAQDRSPDRQSSTGESRTTTKPFEVRESC